MHARGLKKANLAKHVNPQRLGSEKHFRMLLDGVRDYAIFVLDPKGNVASWNSGAQKLTFYSAEEIVGQHFSSLYLPGAVSHEKPERDLKLGARQGYLEYDGQWMRKDGSQFWARII